MGLPFDKQFCVQIITDLTFVALTAQIGGLYCKIGIESVSKPSGGLEITDVLDFDDLASGHV